MNREVRRLLLEFVDGAFLLVLLIIASEIHNAGVSILDLLLDSAVAALLAFWIESIWWFWGKWR